MLLEPRPQPSRDSPDGDRCEAAEQELRTFAYFVSHDLAACFRQVTEFSRLIVSDPVASERDSHTRYILAASMTCQSMLEQLLVFSRVQQQALAKVTQDATTVVRLLTLQLSAPARALGGEVTTEPLGEVFADKDLFALAMRHLLDNAFKFRRAGVASRVSIEAAHDAAYWRVRITDNGLGVEPAYRERAFQMFQRLNREEGNFPGIGAGLAICRRIARRHLGDVRFLDCETGACVELALPRAAKLQADDLRWDD